MWDLKCTGINEIIREGKEENKRQEWYKKFREGYLDNKKVLQIGVSGGKIVPHAVGIDLYDKRDCIDYNIDICKSIGMVDFINKFDFIICNAVLEHVKNPFDAAKNLINSLRINGMVYLEVPFIQPYHPFSTWNEEEHGILGFKDDHEREHGGDYWRFTPQGMVELFKELEMVQIILANTGGIVYIGRKV